MNRDRIVASLFAILACVLVLGRARAQVDVTPGGSSRIPMAQWAFNGNPSTFGIAGGTPDANHPVSAIFNQNSNVQDLWWNNNPGNAASAERCAKSDTVALCISAQGVNLTVEPQRTTLYTNCGAGCTSGNPGIDVVSCFASTPTLCNTRFFTNSTDGIVGERFRVTSVGLVMNSANAAVVQMASTTQANLATVLTTNGMMIYCSDCTIANPCAGAGTGALAKRLNGVNVCN